MCQGMRGYQHLGHVEGHRTADQTIVDFRRIVDGAADLSRGEHGLIFDRDQEPRAICVDMDTLARFSLASAFTIPDVMAVSSTPSFFALATKSLRSCSPCGLAAMGVAAKLQEKRTAATHAKPTWVDLRNRFIRHLHSLKWQRS